MKHHNTNKLIALIVAATLILSITAFSADAFAEIKNTKDVKKEKKSDKKKIIKSTVKTTEKKTETKKVEIKPTSTFNSTTSAPAPAVDPMEQKLLACKTKETQREQYECEKALKASSGDTEFKAKASSTKIGPITFYYAGAKVEHSGGKDILNLKFLVENTGSKDNVSLFCTGPAVCNYDVSDGTTIYKYASQDFTNGQIVLIPGKSRMFNMLFGPAIGYGSYIDFKFEPSKEYTFNVHEPWGSGNIPLNLK